MTLPPELPEILQELVRARAYVRSERVRALGWLRLTGGAALSAVATIILLVAGVAAASATDLYEFLTRDPTGRQVLWWSFVALFLSTAFAGVGAIVLARSLELRAHATNYTRALVIFLLLHLTWAWRFWPGHELASGATGDLERVGLIVMLLALLGLFLMFAAAPFVLPQTRRRFRGELPPLLEALDWRARLRSRWFLPFLATALVVPAIGLGLSQILESWNPVVASFVLLLGVGELFNAHMHRDRDGRLLSLLLFALAPLVALAPTQPFVTFAVALAIYGVADIAVGYRQYARPPREAAA